VNRRFSNADYLLVAVILLHGWITIADFQLRLAEWFHNDNPVTYACATKFPETYDDDFVAVNQLKVWRRYAVAASMQNWVPALLYTGCNIDPYPVARCLGLLQGTAIGVGVYLFVSITARHRMAALFAAVFCYMANPWGLNLANYGSDSSWTYTPYAAYGALGPMLMALALAITRKYWYGAFALNIYAGLMHPTMGLFCAAVIGSLYLVKLYRRQVSAWRLVLLCFSVALFVAPVIVAGASVSGTPVEREELMAGLMINPHHVPWGEKRFQHAWPAILQWLMLAFMGFQRRDQFSEDYVQLWFCTLVTVAIFSISHLLGFVLQIPFFLGLTGLRSIALLSLVSLPLVSVYMLNNLQSGQFLRIVFGLLFFTIPFLGEQYAIVGYLTLSLVLLECSMGQLGPFKFSMSEDRQIVCRVLAVVVLVGWGASFLGASARAENPGWLLQTHAMLTWHAFRSDPTATTRLLWLVAVIAVGGLVVSLSKKFDAPTTIQPTEPKSSNQLLWMLALGYCMIFLANSSWKRNDLVNSRTRDLLAAQLWARQHSPPDSLFLTTWRNAWVATARRRHFYPISFGLYSYKGFEESKSRRDRLLAFYGIPKDFAVQNRGTRVESRQRQLMRKFGDDDWLRFSDAFGVTHVVTIRAMLSGEVSLPIAFQNRSVLIYDLQRARQEKN